MQRASYKMFARCLSSWDGWSQLPTGTDGTLSFVSIALQPFAGEVKEHCLQFQKVCVRVGGHVADHSFEISRHTTDRDCLEEIGLVQPGSRQRARTLICEHYNVVFRRRHSWIYVGYA